MTASTAQHVYEEYEQAVRNGQHVLAHQLYGRLLADDETNAHCESDRSTLLLAL